MGQILGYILSLKFLSSAVSVLQKKNETKNFYVLKFIIHLKYHDIWQIKNCLSKNMHKSIFGMP